MHPICPERQRTADTPSWGDMFMIKLNLTSRKQVRLSGYDYGDPGSYFVTICTKNRRPYFGRINEFAVELSLIGSVVDDCWRALPDWFSNVSLDAYVIMPDHLHGIIRITDRGRSLDSILGTFKSGVTRRCRESNLLDNQALWQRGYFEHVVRTERALVCMRRYILDNPTQWDLEKLLMIR
jgi:putative transposase